MSIVSADQSATGGTLSYAVGGITTFIPFGGIQMNTLIPAGAVITAAAGVSSTVTYVGIIFQN